MEHEREEEEEANAFGGDEPQSDSNSISDSDDSREEAMGSILNTASREESEAEEDASTSSGRPRITFNQSLPSQHNYLGGDLEDVGGGQTLMEEGSIVDRLPLLPLPGLILTPGQTLPLNSLHPRQISMFRRIISNHRVFGVVNMQFDQAQGRGYKLADVGTAAQVLAFKELTEHDITTLKIRAIGRQRFRILESKFNMDGTLEGKVLIHPEITLSDPLSCTGLSSAMKFRINSRKRCKALTPNKPHRWYRSVVTPWLPSVLEKYDESRIVIEISRELSNWYDPDKVEKMAENRTEFSYWLASNLPIDDDTKLRLLSINCSLERLIIELSIMKRYSQLCCAECGDIVGQKSDIFSMSLEGPMGAYVNPGGYVHEMITLRQVSNIEGVSPPTTENSWFPGYAWIILQCSHCKAHMGWKFKAVESGLKPSRFWGLTRSSISPKMDENDTEQT